MTSKTISGHGSAYLLSGSGVTLTNIGTVTGTTAIAVTGTGDTIINAGTVAGSQTSGFGVSISAGGSITNQSAGTISGKDGIKIAGGAGTVVNAGQVTGSSYAVLLAAGFTNLLVADPGAIFSGTVSGGNSIGSAHASTLELATGTGHGTLTGLGSSFVDFAQLTVDSGASWTLAGANTLSAGAGVTNLGSLFVTGSLASAGVLSGGPGGLGVTVQGGTLANSGAIEGGSGKSGASAYTPGARGGTGVSVTSGGLTNSGTIQGGNGGRGDSAYGGYGGTGVYLTSGTLWNSGTVTGGYGGSGGSGFYGAGEGGNGGAGISLTTGAVINTGTISGGAGGGGGFSALGFTAPAGQAGLGVVFTDGGTLTNAGVIDGGYGDARVIGSGDGVAVDFGSGASRLIVDPGAVFHGSVDADAALTNVLELASAATTGTLSGLGTQFVGFGQVTVDGGASWILGSGNTIGAGVTLTNSGSLASDALLNSAGAIIGAPGSAGIAGNYGYDPGSQGGYGGSGNNAIALTAGGDLINLHVITGGAGGRAGNGRVGGDGGTGGDGVSIAKATLINSGMVGGGAGGRGVTGSESAGSPGGSGGTGVYLASGGLTNSGGILGGSGGAGGVGQPSYGGSYGFHFNPGPGGPGGAGGAGVYIVTGSLTNTGIIHGGAGGTGGTGGFSDYFPGANGPGGAGVVFKDGGTLTDAGAIAGARYADAINFGTGAARLILDPGAVLGGAVVADATLANVLELASATAVGVLAGLGIELTGFDQVTVDTGASWSLTAQNSIASGVTLVNNGTLTNTGLLQDGGDLHLTRTIGGSGFIQIEAGGTLELASGAIAGNNTIDMAGLGTTLRIDNLGTVSQPIFGLGVGSRLDLAAAPTITAAINGDTLLVTAGTAKLDFISGSSLAGLKPEITHDAGTGSVITLYSPAAGTLTPDPLAIGAVHQSSTVSILPTVTNTSPAGADTELLDASLSSSAAGFTTSGRVTGLAGGASNDTDLSVTLNTAKTGPISGTATLALASVGTGIDNSGTTVLPSETLAVTGTVFALAVPHLSAGTINLGDARSGGPALTGTFGLSDGSAASQFQEGLQFAFATDLPAGLTLSSDAGAISSGRTVEVGVTLATTAAAAVTAASLTGAADGGAFASTGAGTSGLANTTLAPPPLTVTGSVFATAIATPSSETVNFGVVHVGAPVTPVTIDISNTATGALTDLLTAGTVAKTGSYTGAVTPALGSGVAAGAAGAIGFALNTGTAGAQAGTVSIGLFSHDSVLSNLALAPLPINVTATIDNYATATIKDLSGQAITGTATAEVLNLGTIARNSGSLVAELDVSNTAIGPADALGGSFTVPAAAGFTNSGFGAFSSLAAGQASNTGTVILSSATAGRFSETLTIAVTGTDADYSGTLAPQTLTITGLITNVATPATGALAVSSTVAATLGGDTYLTSGTLGFIAGNQTLVGVTGFDQVFSGTAAGLNGDTITGFGGIGASADKIDVTDLLPGAAVTFVPSIGGGDASQGVLMLNDGTRASAITMAGDFATGSFHLATDGHAGSFVTYLPS